MSPRLPGEREQLGLQEALDLLLGEGIAHNQPLLRGGGGRRGQGHRLPRRSRRLLVARHLPVHPHPHKP